MKLIDLLVQELPKRGGWKFGINAVYQDWDGELRIDSEYNSSTKMFFPLSEIVRERAKMKHSLPDDAFVTRDQYEAAIAASKQDEWDGKTLPTCGTKCEWQDTNTKVWMPVSVVYSSEWVTVIREDAKNDAVELAIENFGDEARRQFRPIRTEAERKRDESLKSLIMTIAGFMTTEDQTLAANIYDAISTGKIPGLKLDL